MQRFWMKAHWFRSTRALNLGANLVAKTFAANLAKMLMRLADNLQGMKHHNA
jgi:hypothetical protein